MRLNFSTPYRKHFTWLKQALPDAIKESESGIYRKAVIKFFNSVATRRGKRIAQDIAKIK